MDSLNIKEVYAVLDELNTYSNKDLSEHLVKLYGITYFRAKAYVSSWLVHNGESVDQRITELTEEEEPMAQEGTGKSGTVKVDQGSHYRGFWKGLKLDPFRLAAIIGITCPIQFTIFKKAWRMGTSVKDRRQDLLDIISAAERGIEIMDEDLAEENVIQTKSMNPPNNLAM